MLVKLDLIQSLVRDPAAVLGAFRCSRSYRLCLKQRNIDSLLASSVHFFSTESVKHAPTSVLFFFYLKQVKTRYFCVYDKNSRILTAPECTEHGNRVSRETPGDFELDLVL